MTRPVERLGRELTQRAPLGPRPAKINTATDEGKRWKAVLLAEIIDLRQRGHTFREIHAATGVSADAMASWLITVRRHDLIVQAAGLAWKDNPNCESCGQALPEKEIRKRRYCGEQCRDAAPGETNARALLQLKQAAETSARRARVDTLRREYRRRRAAGEALPWHVLREKPTLTPEEQAQLQVLIEEQVRDGRDAWKVGRRPWLVSLNGNTPDEDAGALLDTLVDWRSYSEAEALMKANGTGALYRRSFRSRPWRVHRPQREIRRAA